LVEEELLREKLGTEPILFSEYSNGY
jgi:hypothetical protein